MQITKTYNFTADTEEWVGTPTDSRNVMLWYPPHKGRSASKSPTLRPDPPLSVLGGCLRTTARSNSVSSENYWELTKTWEDLGVPAGGVVTGIKADYQYRYVMYTKNRQTFNDAYWGTNETGTGPFTLLDNSETPQGTFSDRVYCKVRTADDPWMAYPDGVNPELITEHPTAFEQVVGSNISVPAGIQASNTTIKLRLANLMPVTGVFEKWVTNNLWVRLKQDRIELTITYSSGTGATANIKNGTIRNGVIK